MFYWELVNEIAAKQTGSPSTIELVEDDERIFYTVDLVP